MSYFISPPDATSWSISGKDLTAALRVHWPDAEIKAVLSPQSNHSIEWRIQLGEKQLEGSCDRTGQAIHLDGDLISSALFALWFRSIVPSQQSLVFYDEGYSADVNLTNDTSVEQITGPFIH
jgi:hypothetical protein